MPPLSSPARLRGVPPLSSPARLLRSLTKVQNESDCLETKTRKKTLPKPKAPAHRKVSGRFLNNEPKQKKKEKPPYPLSATTRGLTACRITMAPSSTSHRMAPPAPNSCRSRRCARGSSTSSRRARRMGLAP